MIEEISVFLAVVDAGSLPKVARERGMAVSSVSRKLDALENDMGVKLLHRSSRFVMLTDAGEQFVPRARAILPELDDACYEISAASADPRGLLTIAAPASFGRRHVAPAGVSFLRQYPGIEVVLHFSDPLLDLRAQRVGLRDYLLVAEQAAQSGLQCGGAMLAVYCRRTDPLITMYRFAGDSRENSI